MSIGSPNDALESGTKALADSARTRPRGRRLLWLLLVVMVPCGLLLLWTAPSKVRGLHSFTLPDGVQVTLVSVTRGYSPPQVGIGPFRQGLRQLPNRWGEKLEHWLGFDPSETDTRWFENIGVVSEEPFIPLWLWVHADTASRSTAQLIMVVEDETGWWEQSVVRYSEPLADGGQRLCFALPAFPREARRLRLQAWGKHPQNEQFVRFAEWSADNPNPQQARYTWRGNPLPLSVETNGLRVTLLDFQPRARFRPIDVPGTVSEPISHWAWPELATNRPAFASFEIGQRESQIATWDIDRWFIQRAESGNAQINWIPTLQKRDGNRIHCWFAPGPRPADRVVSLAMRLVPTKSVSLSQVITARIPMGRFSTSTGNPSLELGIRTNLFGRQLEVAGLRQVEDSTGARTVMVEVASDESHPHAPILHCLRRRASASGDFEFEAAKKWNATWSLWTFSFPMEDEVAEFDYELVAVSLNFPEFLIELR